jgi:hypothetical protein
MPFLRTIALAAAASTVYAIPTEKRQDACQPLSQGSGPVPSPDTVCCSEINIRATANGLQPDAFLAYQPFSTAALAAVTPAGYVQAYSNLNSTYDSNTQFVLYTQMTTYDVQACKYIHHRSLRVVSLGRFFDYQAPLNHTVGISASASN